ncbi:MAG: T9SS type A sorting domain-containing protein, partial [Bacteroidia bacterium]|nr:T9SS type A sorting domain-containing protein [Bacteroidia bacterium]
ENATLVDPMQWDLSGSFNVDITDGVNTIQMRIDSDIDISGMEPPTGTFTVTGTGGQFDNESPFDSGYQIFPRSTQDIDPYNIAEEEFEIISIAEARQIDTEGVLTKDGDKVELNGVVHGINLRPSGLQFALIEATNTGIMVFSLSDQFGYTVTEGDDITIQGELSQFNGLAQIEPEAITLNSSSNDLVDPLQVNILDESTESSLVMVQAQSLDDSQWLGDGSSFNVDIVTANGDTLLMRIDSDTELSSMSSPGSGVFIIGIGGQFDTSEPYNEGYQILPRYITDFMPYLSTEDVYQGSINIYPNPVTNLLTIDAEDTFHSLGLYDLQGKLLLQGGNQKTIDVRSLESGCYILRIQFEDSHVLKPIIVNR